MNIEFLGLPGAGKTTIRKRIIEELTLRKHSTLSTEDAFYLKMKTSGDSIYRYILRLLPNGMGKKLANNLHGRSLYQNESQNHFIACHGGSLRAFLNSVVFKNMSTEDKENVIGNFLAMGSLWDMLNCQDFANSILFFEEGFIQKSFMFVDHEYDYPSIATNIHDYFQAIPLPNIVIHIKTDISTSYERMLSRQDGLTKRLKNASPKAINTFLSHTEAHIQNIRNELSLSTDCQVIEITNEGDLNVTLNQLVDQVENYI